MDKNYLLYVISLKILFDEIRRFILNVCKPKIFENKKFSFWTLAQKISIHSLEFISPRKG